MTILVLEHRLEVARYPHHKPATFLFPVQSLKRVCGECKNGKVNVK